MDGRFPFFTGPVLGIETSCDETAVAVVGTDGRILSNVVASQVAIHHEYGGVVPELASRHHLRNIVPVLRSALAEAALALDGISGVAVTAGPGLVGALLVGVQTGKVLSLVTGAPLVGVDHLLSHLDAIYLYSDPAQKQETPAFPYVYLLVSGGHTAVGVREEAGSLEPLGATRDDAAGEAYDKVAKMLGLGYPGGRVIDELAADGRPDAIAFPRGMLSKHPWDFSFSGLKTAVRQHLSREGIPRSRLALADLCASFQEAVVDVLVARTCAAVKETGIGRVVLAGGVAANRRLRMRLRAEAERLGARVFIPPAALCTDNAAMVAAAGHRRLAAGDRDALDLNAVATWAYKR